MVAQPPPIPQPRYAPYPPAAVAPVAPFPPAAPYSPAAPVIPYATPVSAAPPAPIDAAWQDGPVLVVRNGVILPPRCVKCNDVADGAYRKCSMSWHNPLLYLLILPGLVVYLLVAMSLQERGSIGVHLCANHRRRRLTLLWTAWAFAFAAAAALFDGVASDSPVLALTALPLFMVALLLGSRCRLLTPKRIDRHFMWLRGAGPAFLRGLPSLPARS